MASRRGPLARQAWRAGDLPITSRMGLWGFMVGPALPSRALRCAAPPTLCRLRPPSRPQAPRTRARSPSPRLAPSRRARSGSCAAGRGFARRSRVTRSRCEGRRHPRAPPSRSGGIAGDHRSPALQPPGSETNVIVVRCMAKIVARANASAFSSSVTTPGRSSAHRLARASSAAFHAAWPIVTNACPGAQPTRGAPRHVNADSPLSLASSDEEDRGGIVRHIRACADSDRHRDVYPRHAALAIPRGFPLGQSDDRVVTLITPHFGTGRAGEGLALMHSCVSTNRARARARRVRAGPAPPRDRVHDVRASNCAPKVLEAHQRSAATARRWRHRGGPPASEGKRIALRPH